MMTMQKGFGDGDGGGDGDDDDGDDYVEQLLGILVRIDYVQMQAHGRKMPW